MTKIDNPDKVVVEILQGTGNPSVERLSDLMVEKALGSAKAHLASFGKALKVGVKIASGADTSSVADHTLLEVEHLARAA